MQQRSTGGKRGFDTAIQETEERSDSVQKKRLSQSLDVEPRVLERASGQIERHID
ncbi:hypothetical protein BofuT4_uP140090.1 [Botrytis cinerea T4]|uniref:Uncharacterized protein n=1 Tax=Botryotinia fuckeliana (strain T4) TaxID=999810 RepID=G2YYP9_BOTF4|nr:hypothetical protein BofuT4_uP140090.1 [Botrytis cinerea T4]